MWPCHLSITERDTLVENYSPLKSNVHPLSKDKMGRKFWETSYTPIFPNGDGGGESLDSCYFILPRNRLFCLCFKLCVVSENLRCEDACKTGRRQPQMLHKCNRRKLHTQGGLHIQMRSLTGKHVIVNAEEQYHIKARKQINQPLTNIYPASLNLRQHQTIRDDPDNMCCPHLAETTANTDNMAAHLCKIQTSTPNNYLGDRTKSWRMKKQRQMWWNKSVWIREKMFLTTFSCIGCKSWCKLYRTDNNHH